MGKRGIENGNNGSTFSKGVTAVEVGKKEPELMFFTNEDAVVLGAMVVSSTVFGMGELGSGKGFVFENDGKAQAPFEILALKHFEEDPNYDKKLLGLHAGQGYYEEIRKKALSKLCDALGCDNSSFQFLQRQDEDLGEILGSLKSIQWDFEAGFTPQVVFAADDFGQRGLEGEKMRIVNLWREFRGEKPIIFIPREAQKATGNGHEETAAEKLMREQRPLFVGQIATICGINLGELTHLLGQGYVRLGHVKGNKYVLRQSDVALIDYVRVKGVNSLTPQKAKEIAKGR